MGKTKKDKKPKYLDLLNIAKHEVWKKFNEFSNGFRAGTKAHKGKEYTRKKKHKNKPDDYD